MCAVVFSVCENCLSSLQVNKIRGRPISMCNLHFRFRLTDSTAASAAVTFNSSPEQSTRQAQSSEPGGDVEVGTPVQRPLCLKGTAPREKHHTVSHRNWRKLGTRSATGELKILGISWGKCVLESDKASVRVKFITESSAQPKKVLHSQRDLRKSWKCKMIGVESLSHWCKYLKIMSNYLRSM